MRDEIFGFCGSQKWTGKVKVYRVHYFYSNTSSSQGETDSLYANIDQAYKEGEQKISRLKKPFRLEMRKSEVLASYRVYYRGVSNSTSVKLPCVLCIEFICSLSTQDQQKLS